jgi:hypothetical protein
MKNSTVEGVMEEKEYNDLIDLLVIDAVREANVKDSDLTYKSELRYNHKNNTNYTYWFWTANFHKAMNRLKREAGLIN